MNRRRTTVVAFFAVIVSALSVCGCPTENTIASQYTYRVINTYPHDIAAFTQGLLFEDGVFYESTGLWNQSSLRRVAVETGQVERIYRLPNEYFAEGLTLFDDRLIQITWQSGKGFVYNVSDFNQTATFTYTGEGWGITHDGTRLIMSDGTAELRFLNPETFEETGRVTVKRNGEPVTRLNELEYVEGEVYANVWQTNNIMRINPETGEVISVIDCTGLLELTEDTRNADVLNGIAYDPETKRLWVTGKRWSNLFEIELVPVEEPEEE